jgi:hypothetical protein
VAHPVHRLAVVPVEEEVMPAGVVEERATVALAVLVVASLVPPAVLTELLMGQLTWVLAVAILAVDRVRQKTVPLVAEQLKLMPHRVQSR